MAHAVKTDSTGTYIVVVSGDTLSGIASEFKGNPYNIKNYSQLANLNNIKNPDHIVIDQKIYLTKSGSGSSTTKKTDPYTPVVTQLGRQVSNPNTLLAVWTFGKESETEKYETWWEYDLGDGTWFIDKGTVDTDVKYVKYATWSIREGTKAVKFYVKAISKTKSDGKTTYFTGKWSTVKKWTNTVPLNIPTGLTAEIKNHTLTATVPSIEMDSATHICFQIVRDNTKVFKTIDAKIEYVKSSTLQETGTASCSCEVTPGSEYKVRCYAYSKKKDGYWSDWSDYTSNYSAVPSKVSSITHISALREASQYGIYLKWSESKTAESYEIQYLNKKDDFDVVTNIPSTTVEGQTECKIYSLDAGKEYFVRIRAKNGTGNSDWSEIKSVILGTKPIVPTTWSSTTTATVGEDLLLYWVHNSADGSSQTEATLELSFTIDGINTTQTHTVKNLTDEEEKDKTRVCTINTTNATISWVDDTGIVQKNLEITFKEGAKLEWRVRTKGIHDEYGEYSTQKSVDIYARPTLALEIGAATYYRVETTEIDDSTIEYVKTEEEVDISTGYALSGALTTTNDQVYVGATVDGEELHYCYEISELVVDDQEVGALPVITKFPFYLSALPGPATQIPLSYHVSVTANQAYETTDNIGNFKMVNAGEQIYSKYFDIKHELLVEFSPGNIDLENNADYTVTCTVAMNSGLTAESSLSFVVGWVEMECVPNAEIAIDTETLTASIQPYCSDHTTEYHKVEKVGRTYTVTETVYDFVCGEAVRNATTTTGEQVYWGSTVDGEEVYYCEIEVITPVTDVYMSVYRREFDGGFTELARMIDGSNRTAITDPHPALDFARYRVVATSKTTGAVSYYDLQGVPVNGSAVIIQWDEAWSSFETTDGAQLAEPEWSGSMLKLPYNIDVSDSTDPEVELIEYIGREHPVSYYGTHRGQRSTWSVVIRKDDEETLYGLRRLAMWMDDVYVREPSGSGYWANIKVSFSQKHDDLTVPVSLSITRVEGGA